MNILHEEIRLTGEQIRQLYKITDAMQEHYRQSYEAEALNTENDTRGLIFAQVHSNHGTMDVFYLPTGAARIMMEALEEAKKQLKQAKKDIVK